MSKSGYTKDLTTDGKLDKSKVFLKMSKLRDAHMKDGTVVGTANNIAFEYGRELIGYDAAQEWLWKVLS
jgi:hypothetical protein